MNKPYGILKMACSYLGYYFSAANSKGHGTHSPFLFDFITKVLNGKADAEAISKIESLRFKLLQDASLLEVDDFGAGSHSLNINRRSVAKIAATSLKSPKYAQLIYRMVRHYQPDCILELGTSLGLTTAYMAFANPKARVFSIEGASSIASRAADHLNSLGVNNVRLIQGRFADCLPQILEQSGPISLAFIDGHHSLRPTLEYFRSLSRVAAPACILIFDDIHWSPDMEAAWRQIKQEPGISMTIDLFFMGIAVINPDIKHPQHVSIRY